jgi:hypothetical protein
MSGFTDVFYEANTKLYRDGGGGGGGGGEEGGGEEGGDHGDGGKSGKGQRKRKGTGTGTQSGSGSGSGKGTGKGKGRREKSAGTDEEVDSSEGSENDGDGEDEDEDEDGDGCSHLRLYERPLNVETGEDPQYWFEPTEVWEICGADITLSPVHMAGRGLLGGDAKGRGMSLRFPRFIRKRPDKTLRDATTPAQIAAMFERQPQRNPQGKAGKAGPRGRECENAGKTGEMEETGGGEGQL